MLSCARCHLSSGDDSGEDNNVENHAKSMLDMAQARDDWFSEVLPVNVTGAMSEEAVEEQRSYARTGFTPSRNEGQSVGPSRSTHQP
jgi:hypothetical protein